MSKLSLLPLFLAGAAFAASCAVRPDTAADHSHRVTTTVTVTDAAILPAAMLAIPFCADVQLASPAPFFAAVGARNFGFAVSTSQVLHVSG